MQLLSLLSSRRIGRDIFARSRRHLIGVSGAAGVGKDEVAGWLCRHAGFVRIAFADALYEEVAAAFATDVARLRDRRTKETPVDFLTPARCRDAGFRALLRSMGVGLRDRISPRQTLQWWGTEYRRRVDPRYWIGRLAERVITSGAHKVVVPDVRFLDEAEIIRGSGGALWQVRRLGCGDAHAHVSENWRALMPFVTRTIWNDADLETLYHKIEAAYAQESLFEFRACVSTAPEMK